MRSETFWIVAVMPDVSPDERRPHLLCKRCGVRLVQELPMSVRSYVRIANDFIDAHRGCPEPAQPVTQGAEIVTRGETNPLEVHDARARSESLATETVGLGEATDVEVNQ